MDNNVQSILKFNLDTQEGRDAHMRACKAEQAYRSMHEIQQLMRKYDKYGLPADLQKLDKEGLVLFLREQITDVIVGNGIDLDEEYR